MSDQAANTVTLRRKMVSAFLMAVRVPNEVRATAQTLGVSVRGIELWGIALRFTWSTLMLTGLRG